MRGTSIHKRKTARRGIAYVALLLLLTLLFTLGMVFLMQTANDSAAVLVRGNSMQAHYLAESAANHALWLLLNEDVYSLDSDTYYMHSFAGGRYGYKIRPHTDTTFATIATVGAIGDSVVRQSYVVYVAPPKEPINLMFLTSGLLFPTSQESDRIALMESWGFAVDTLYTGS